MEEDIQNYLLTFMFRGTLLQLNITIIVFKVHVNFDDVFYLVNDLFQIETWKEGSTKRGFKSCL